MRRKHQGEQNGLFPTDLYENNEKRLTYLSNLQLVNINIPHTLPIIHKHPWPSLKVICKGSHPRLSALLQTVHTENIQSGKSSLQKNHLHRITKGQSIHIRMYGTKSPTILIWKVRAIPLNTWSTFNTSIYRWSIKTIDYQKREIKHTYCMSGCGNVSVHEPFCRELQCGISIHFH